MLDLNQLVIYRKAEDFPISKRATGYLGYRSPSSPYRFAAAEPSLPIIPRDQWAARIKALEGHRVAERLPLPAKDQNGLPLCWAYGSTRALEYKRAIEGLPFLDLSPESVAGPCTRWRPQGGYASEAFAQLHSGGACEMSYMDRPHSLFPDKWNPGWIENASLHEAVDWLDMPYTDPDGPFDSVMSALLQTDDNGNQSEVVAAGLSWWGHLVCFVSPILLPWGSAEPNTPTGDIVGVVFQNSWGPDWPRKGDKGFAVLTERYATPDGAAMPILST